MGSYSVTLGQGGSEGSDMNKDVKHKLVTQPRQGGNERQRNLNPVAKNLSKDGADCIFLPSFANLSVKTGNEDSDDIVRHKIKRNSSMPKSRQRPPTNEGSLCRRSKSLHCSQNKK